MAWTWGAPSPDLERDLHDLAKRYRHACEDLEQAKVEIALLPTSRSASQMPVPGYDGRVWKRRYPNADAQRGKSGGYRLWYLVEEISEHLHVLRLLCKSDAEDLPRRALDHALLSVEATPPEQADRCAARSLLSPSSASSGHPTLREAGRCGPRAGAAGWPSGSSVVRQ
jgi:mRNA-degrading endonuclease RelE of RelBE toxin-antitoxin system